MFNTYLGVDVGKFIAHLSKMSSECQVTHIFKNWMLVISLLNDMH